MRTHAREPSFIDTEAYLGSRVEIARAALAACEMNRAGGSSRIAFESRPDSPELALRGGLHEWFGADDRKRGSAWLPPMGVLIGLAWRVAGSATVPGAGPSRRVVWVGRRCWPYPPALVRHGPDGADRRLLDASVFVDPASRQERVWAVELAARCAGVGIVIGDGSELAMAESRRLQLASKDTPLMLARPSREVRELSAARTRWRVSPLAMNETENDRCQEWAVELLRCKGLRPETPGDARRWVVRRDHGTGWSTSRSADQIEDTWRAWSAGDGGVAAAVGDGPDPASRTQIA
ncbi:MAG: hypothetical protein AAGB51_01350 [Planctomycetota bacterium]